MHKQSSYYAALDLGSNSFHLIVVQVTASGIQEVDKIKHMVRLGEGLGKDNMLDDASIKRALTALGEMRQRIEHIPRDQVRAVGTNTMRVAKNGEEFLRKAEKALGADIEIISGNEEARLIYLGISEHNFFKDVTLVIDVGGGSTEVIIGEGETPKVLRSMKIGCANMANKFFPRGKITKTGIKKALSHVAVTIEPHVKELSMHEYQRAVMSSGTAKSTEKVLQKLGISNQGITRQGLHRLLEVLLEIGHADKLAERLEIDPARAFGFTGGVCILAGLCDILDIESAFVSQAALREGVLLDLMGRDEDDSHDERELTVAAMQHRFTVDTLQAERVAKMAQHINAAMAQEAPLRFAPLLGFAAQLHEIGLAVARGKQHQHGAYLMEHADMPGFSQVMQKMMAILLRGQRKKLPAKLIRELNPAYQEFIWQYLLALRLAVLLYRSRVPLAESDWPTVKLKDKILSLSFSEQYLQKHPLSVADLQEELKYWDDAPFSLQVNFPEIKK